MYFPAFLNTAIIIYSGLSLLSDYPAIRGIGLGKDIKSNGLIKIYFTS